jgi:O-antigen ligase
MPFVLFLLLNFLLFVRPTDYLPGVMGQQFYALVILICLLLSFPQVLQQLSGRALQARPVTLCVVGLLAAVLLSHLSHGKIEEAFASGIEFVKKVLYYLLLVSLVTSSARLRRLLLWLGCCFTIITALTVLEYKDILKLPTFKASIKDGAGIDRNTYEELQVDRLKASGVFNDPNDFALLLVVGVPLSLYFLTDRRLGITRLAWLVPLGLFLYALALTYSRGGFLALMAGLAVLVRSRLSLAKSLALGAVVVPLLLVLFGGRQTNISTSVNTGQARVDLWADGLVLIQQAPVFGIGEGLYAKEAGQVAHNSYVHAYTELGLFGGTLFLGAFLFALLTLWRYGDERHYHIVDPEMRRLRPFLLGSVAAYATGLMALSNCFIEPTYTVLGLATAFGQVTAVYPPVPVLRFNARLAQRLALTSVAFLGAIYVFVRMFRSVYG